MQVSDDATHTERRVCLSSVRAPRAGNPRRDIKPEPYGPEAKEFLRQRLVGATVKVSLDYQRALQAGDAMAFGTVTVPGGAGSGGGGGGIPGAAAPVMNGGEPEVRASTRVPSNNVVCCYPAASNVCPSHKGVCVSLCPTP